MPKQKPQLPETITVNMAEAELIGENVTAVEAEGLLIIVVDPKMDFGVREGGKLSACANSKGFQDFPFDLRGNIYLGRKPAGGKSNAASIFKE